MHTHTHISIATEDLWCLHHSLNFILLSTDLFLICPQIPSRSHLPPHVHLSTLLESIICCITDHMDYKGRLKGQKSWQIKRRRMEPEKLKGNWIEGEEEHVWEK